MSDNTPITGELRELLADISWTEIIDHMQMNSGATIDGSWLDSWRAAADRACDAIDAIHANLERENESLKAKLDSARGEWDFWESTHVELPKDGEAPSKQLSEWIENRGLVTGPLDANGELWHSGDMSDSPWGVIESIAFYGNHWQVSGHDTSAPWIPADSISHYHAPTVEDVLREFAEKITDSQIPGVHPTYEEAIAEYAKRLMLAGE